MKIRASLIVAIAASLFAVNSQAVLIKMKANLDGGQEVGPVATKAEGKAKLKFNTETNLVSFSLKVTGIFLQDITFPGGPLAFGTLGPVHLHDGIAGSNGNIILPFGDLASYKETGNGFMLKAKDLVAPAGLAKLLSIGSVYVNVHTLAYGGGEIRGQLSTAVPEPASIALLGLAGMGLMLRRRKALNA